MKREIMEKWVAALREPNRKQGFRALENKATGEQCCLGVLCRIAEAEGATFRVNDDDDIFVRYRDDDNSRDCTAETLPESVMSWAEVRDPCGEYTDVHGARWVLAELNDTARLTFPEIANIIEKNWERL